MVYAVLDPAARSIVFANAGHLRPLFIDDEGDHLLEVERGLPLGVAYGEYSETEISLAPGSRLIFYSDGITEALNLQDEEYGMCRLVEHAIRPDASAVSIVDEVQSYSNEAGVRDDASVVFVGVTR